MPNSTAVVIATHGISTAKTVTAFIPIFAVADTFGTGGIHAPTVKEAQAFPTAVTIAICGITAETVRAPIPILAVADSVGSGVTSALTVKWKVSPITVSVAVYGCKATSTVYAAHTAFAIAETR
jgi:hypothetical protein